MSDQRIHNGPLTADNGPRSAPAWFRYGIIAAAAIIMCSCRAAEPRYRIAGNQPAAPQQQPQLPATMAMGNSDVQYIVPGPAESQVQQVAYAEDAAEASLDLQQPADLEATVIADDSESSAKTVASRSSGCCRSSDSSDEASA